MMEDSGADPALALRAEPVSRLVPPGFDRGEGCSGKWGDCPNARPSLNSMGHRCMRCKITGKHPDECAA